MEGAGLGSGEEHGGPEMKRYIDAEGTGLRISNPQILP